MSLKFTKLIPMVSHRVLLFIATAAWAIAGIILMIRGWSGVTGAGIEFVVKIIGSYLGGIAFYLIMFKKISNKNVSRIFNNSEPKLPFYAFFNAKGYVMMILMISLGITVRKAELVPFEYLALFYITMGTPLFMSAFKYLYYAVVYKRDDEKVREVNEVISEKLKVETPPSKNR